MRILVVEDEVKVANALKEGFEDERYETVVAHTGEDAFFRITTEQFDVILLDVRLPDLDGFAVCRRLRDKGLALPVLMLTARDAVGDRVTGLDAGADDYLVKPFASEELLARVRALLRRGEEPRELLAFGDLVFDVEARSARRGGEGISLSVREADLLELLLRNPRRVVSRQQALERVWGSSAAASPNVVDRYVSYLRRKLGEPKLIQTVRGVGFVLER